MEWNWLTATQEEIYGPEARKLEEAGADKKQNGWEMLATLPTKTNSLRINPSALLVYCLTQQLCKGIIYKIYLLYYQDIFTGVSVSESILGLLE